MEDSMHVVIEQVGLMVDRLKVGDLRCIKSRKPFSTMFSVDKNSSLIYNRVYYDEESNTIYSIGSFPSLFISTAYSKKCGDESLVVEYSFDFENPHDKDLVTFKTGFKHLKVDNNKIEFFIVDSEIQQILTKNILELDYYLSKQVYFNKNELMKYKSGTNFMNYSEDKDEDGYFSVSFGKMIKGFDDTRDFSFSDSPRYFLNYFIIEKKLIGLEFLTEKDLKEVFCFLTKISNIILDILYCENFVGVSEDLESNAYACLYNSLSLTLTTDNEFLDEKFLELVRNDELSLKLKVFDNESKEIQNEDLLYFNFKNLFFLPFDELTRKNINFVEIYCKEKSFGRFSIEKYREMAGKKIIFKID